MATRGRIQDLPLRSGKKRKTPEPEPEPEVQEEMETGTSHDSSSSASAAAGLALPTTLEQHMRKVDRHTVTYGGSTFIKSARADGSINQWHLFPWEDVYPAINLDQIKELQHKYRLWKCVGIEVEIKNPTCTYEQGTTNGVVSTGQNDQSQLYLYKDELYQLGVRERS